MPMPTEERLHTTASELLRRKGHRYTQGRRRLVAALHAARAPATIPQLVSHDDELTMSSTYRNLALLEEAGVVARIITLDDHARYELAERVTQRHHHHLVCVGCGDVRDFELSEDLERSLDSELKRAGQAERFAVESHSLDLLGICHECA